MLGIEVTTSNVLTVWFIGIALYSAPAIVTWWIKPPRRRGMGIAWALCLFFPAYYIEVVSWNDHLSDPVLWLAFGEFDQVLSTDDWRDRVVVKQPGFMDWCVFGGVVGYLLGGLLSRKRPDSENGEERQS